MKDRPWLLAAAVGVAWLVAVRSPRFVVVALVVTAVAGVLYGWSLWRHPWWPCKRCSGGKSHRDRLWTKATGRCRKCGGKGQFPRLGVKAFTPGRARELTSGQTGRYG